ncbi:MAG: hypothetical protein WAQ05_20015, partial [Rubrivivax sp.]
MIRAHEFNSRWWGAPVGVVTDAALLDAEAPSVAEACRPYAWAEYSVMNPEVALRLSAQRAGFLSADSYVQFRIDLRRFAPEALPAGVTVRRPGDGRGGWRPEALQPFEHERFSMLDGCTQERLTARY